MPTTRKKIIKTVYKDDESEGETGDFSDSGSDAKISEASSSDEDIIEENDDVSSGDDFRHKAKKAWNDKGLFTTNKPPIRRRKPKFAKDLINKINKQAVDCTEDVPPTSQFSVKDLTEADKLLPSYLNLSESDSSDNESQTESSKKNITLKHTSQQEHSYDCDNDQIQFKDVWSSNVPDDSEDIAQKTFMQLEKHKTEIEQTKASIQNYVSNNKVPIQNVSKNSTGDLNVNDLLAQGEEKTQEKIVSKKKFKAKQRKQNSDSEIEDWEEVNEAKSIPQQGLQLFVEFPDAPKKCKKIDVEMMMKRKINRVKKEYQVYMHKVHVLCWLGHGNYVSRVLNDQEVMAAALAMVPKGCYPEERVTTKYLEQITSWFKDKLTLKQDKNEHKFRPKAPPLKTTILKQITSRVTTAKKYNCFIFVAMLRALGLQCRVMFNFVTIPIKPPASELCSLSTKPKDVLTKAGEKSTEIVNKMGESSKPKANASKCKGKTNNKVPQIDGAYDTYSESDSDFDNIMQLDGNNDIPAKTRSMRSTKAKKLEVKTDSKADEEVSPPKKAKTSKSEQTTKADLSKSSNSKPTNKSGKRKGASALTDAVLTNFKNESLKLQSVTDKDSDSSKVKPPEVSGTTQRRKLTNKKEDVNEQASGSKNRESSKSPQSKTNDTFENNTNVKNTIENKKSIARTDIKAKSSVNDATSEPAKEKSVSTRKVRSDRRNMTKVEESESISKENANKTQIQTKSNKEGSGSKEHFPLTLPTIIVTDEDRNNVESKFFADDKQTKLLPISRKRSHTTIETTNKSVESKNTKDKTRTRTAPGTSVERSKYFDDDVTDSKKPKPSFTEQTVKQEVKQRVSHRDLKQKTKPKNDVTGDLVEIIKSRIKVEKVKADSKKGIIKGKVKDDSDDSDFLPVEDPNSRDASDDDFKPSKISPGPSKVTPKSKVKKLDRRVISSDEEVAKLNKLDVWCEVFVEELEQWIAVDVIKGKVHCSSELYANATHPVTYIVGWDNNNYLKDLTRRYVPQWNTVTRKLRTDPGWWKTSIQPWLGPKTARDREEDEFLDRMQLDAPLPKSIAEYKNHPLYALKRHLLKFEAIYPPEAETLGFVRGEAVYPRDCVYTCRSRDTWVKEAKVVRLGEQPYKVVKARPKWDKLSNRCITDKPLEVFGPWQVQEYEPPTAENGIVPRNPYGNVELFKQCMLPKKTVHLRLPGLNKVAKKLNIDCAPAMTGFDFNGGFSHPVYDGYVVCEEFEQIITEAWVQDQEDQERKENEKFEQRVYGNWKRLFRGLMIRERLKIKYGFEEPPQEKSKAKGPRLVVKKK